MNWRSMSNNELKSFIGSSANPAHQMGAKIELANRATRELDDIPLSAKLHEANEREEIVVWMSNCLTFKYKDKIEANVIDQLIADVRSEFPKLPRHE